MAVVALMMVMHAGMPRAQTEQNSWQKDAGPAKAFCASPALRTTKCGVITEAEGKATIINQCPLCGTLYRALPDKLPTEVEGVDRYNQYAIDVVSLACKGPVVVRSVFKMVDQVEASKKPDWDGTDCSNARLTYVDDTASSKGGSASPIIRCELELPNTGGSEAERAVKAKETKCYKCGLCSEGSGCPSVTGKWYSDSYTTVAKGCDFDVKTGYEAHRVGMNINPYTKILLAKFEVCNNPGCFDPAYEQAKQKTAKACVRGKCAV